MINTARPAICADSTTSAPVTKWTRAALAIKWTRPLPLAPRICTAALTS